MTDQWSALIAPTIAARSEDVETVVQGWFSADANSRYREAIRSACGALGPGSPDGDWPTSVKIDERLRLGVYSPAQIALWQCAKETKDRLRYEYPFLFTTIGMFSRALLGSYSDSALTDWPFEPDDGASRYRELLQSVFHIRELREEGEPLSLEVRLPLSDSGSTDLKARHLAQIFGRGVGVAAGNRLADNPEAYGNIHQIFKDHTGSAMSSLYRLEPTFGHIPEKELRLALRRDGLISLASTRNPLLDFYDGGWHVVDLNSGRVALDYFLDKQFSGEDDGIPEGFSRSLLGLAYHMATHWHGGVLAVLNSTDVDGDLLEKATLTSKKVPDVLREATGSSGKVDMAFIEEKGLGRALLTCAIQDGATVFLPDGTFHSAGRIVSQLETIDGAGTGTRAAKAIGKRGVALKISKDGSIKIFHSPNGTPATPENGLRIR